MSGQSGLGHPARHSAESQWTGLLAHCSITTVRSAFKAQRSAGAARISSGFLGQPMALTAAARFAVVPAFQMGGAYVREENDAHEKFLFTLEWLLAVTRRYSGRLEFGLAHIDFENPKFSVTLTGQSRRRTSLTRFCAACARPSARPTW